VCWTQSFLFPTAEQTNKDVTSRLLLFAVHFNTSAAIRAYRSIFVVVLCAGKLICSWCFCSCTGTNCGVVDHAKFFRALGLRIRELRRRSRYSQEDMISFGFSARQWQQIEAGRPITVTTLLRICDVLKTRIDQIVRGLDRGIYRN
jgi:DNA-binding Xre family transcriptional regulator